jgi:hypothetical protein
MNILSLGDSSISSPHYQPVHQPASGGCDNMGSVAEMAGLVKTGASNLLPPAARVLQSSGDYSTPCKGAACAVLVGKKLTASDIKNTRAILPRLAIETHMPFIMAYRTYGLRLPDAWGAQWSVVIKSWANGRSELALLNQKRRLDRRVFVLEGIAPFLAAHRLDVGSVFGIVVENGVTHTLPVMQSVSRSGGLVQCHGVNRHDDLTSGCLFLRALRLVLLPMDSMLAASFT